MTDNWYATWFDSPYYHKLYAHRDNDEAKAFISALFSHLHIPKNVEVLDLACGKGRHALEINNLGYSVLGVDLSKESITYAQKKATEDLQFERRDMRSLPYRNRFGLVLNLFTSFGYFRKHSDNIKVLSSIYRSLQEGGTFVLDYLNPTHVINGMTTNELVTIENTSFKIHRTTANDRILKHIEVSSPNISEPLHFTEDVGAFDHKLLTHWIESCGMRVEETFGDYELESFDSETSPRTILICRK